MKSPLGFRCTRIDTCTLFRSVFAAVADVLNNTFHMSLKIN